MRRGVRRRCASPRRRRPAPILGALKDHVLAHGCTAAFYSDRHGIFRVNAKDAASGDGKTELGRVCERLRIELIINALTPQASLVPVHKCMF